MLTGVASGLNLLIKALNNINIKTPDWGWLPKKFRGKTYSLDLKPIDTGSFKIPALATGGYVKANTPQLAMIGDNRHQGGSGSTRRETL